jgi:hypothetical protein
MSPRRNYTEEDAKRQATIQDLPQERMRLAIRHTVVTVLEEEVNEFIQAALYQRAPERRDQRNGHCECDLVTTMGEIEKLKVSQTRNGFRAQLFERYQQRQAELDESICEMFVKGISTAQVGGVIEALTGTHPSLSTISRNSTNRKKNTSSGKRVVEGPSPLCFRGWIYDLEGCNARPTSPMYSRPLPQLTFRSLALTCPSIFSIRELSWHTPATIPRWSIR